MKATSHVLTRENRLAIGQLFLLMAALLLLCLVPRQAPALETGDCLGCHADASAVDAPLLIDADRFDHTAHGELGCPVCHVSVTEAHPDDGQEPSKAGCGDCHDEMAADYARTEHAGNAACGDCHNPHAAHAAREVSGVDMNRQCSVCHVPTEMAGVHGVWLPQAGLHLEALPCISCHSGSENYVITLYIARPETGPTADADPLAGHLQLAERAELQTLAGERDIARLVDSDGNGEVSLRELKSFNTNLAYRPLRLRGMLTPETVSHDLQILDNRWDCTFCHASGPAAMQTSFLALPLEDGTFQRLPVEPGAILDALNGTPDFYMMGATRNATLNYLGLAIIAGGLVMPVGHGFLRFLTRKNRP